MPFSSEAHDQRHCPLFPQIQKRQRRTSCARTSASSRSADATFIGCERTLTVLLIKPPNECSGGAGGILSGHHRRAVSVGRPRRLLLQSLGDLADNLWTDEEQLGPKPEVPAIGNSILERFYTPQLTDEAAPLAIAIGVVSDGQQVGWTESTRICVPSTACTTWPRSFLSPTDRPLKS